MLTLALIGFVGGLITGISPCVLPVLPVIFLSGGAQSARRRPDAGPSPEAASTTGTDPDTTPGTDPDTAPTPDPGTDEVSRWRPYLVIAGLVASFSVFTLIGSLLLSLLRLPQDFLRWAGLVVLVILGIGLLVPRVQHLLEKPFSWIPQRSVTTDGNAFVLGLALGAVYVPCAGPVLAAITVAAATGEIGLGTLLLTLAFAVGTAIPLLVFALAGRRVAERVRAFRTRQRGIRIAAGIVMIALAVGLVFNVPEVLQRAIPDYTSALQRAVGGEEELRAQLANDKPQVDGCVESALVLVDCGPAPQFDGIASWLNTPDDAALTLDSLKGSVVLIDFWAYSCINCQRATPHLTAWDKAYRDAGLTIVGVHSPEYAFEKVESNVVAGADRLGIEYPIALDNDFDTWTAYANAYWPAHYLIDASGEIRHIHYGEGGYANTEALIRELLVDANPDVTLPPATEVADTSPVSADQTPEIYFNHNRVSNFRGNGKYLPGEGTFTFPSVIGRDTFGLDGTFVVDDQGITAPKGGRIRLEYHAKHVYLNVAGTGSLTVTDDYGTRTIEVSGEPNIYDLVDRTKAGRGLVTVQLSPGLQAFSFTFG
ncbi:MAG: cytochrome c biogenesis protein DipZ [Microbacteriaceae bacterium]